MTQGLPPALAFLLFAALSFLALRFILDKLARINRAAWAGPVLAVFGALSGAYFHRIGLHQFFVWHLLLFTLVIFSWHAKSRVDEKKLQRITGPSGTEDTAADETNRDVVQSYELTRRLLSFGLVSYLAAFAAAYYFLFTRQ